MCQRLLRVTGFPTYLVLQLKQGCNPGYTLNIYSTKLVTILFIFSGMMRNRFPNPNKGYGNSWEPDFYQNYGNIPNGMPFDGGTYQNGFVRPGVPVSIFRLLMKTLTNVLNYYITDSYMRSHFHIIYLSHNHYLVSM